MTPKHLRFVAVLFAAATTAQAASPSFNCAKASGSVEELICNDAELAELDRSLTSLYSAVLGDGGVYSSLADLYRWDQALYTNELVSAELRDAAFTPGLGTYGFGWRIDSYRGHRRVHHGGATCGFRNFIQRFIDDELTVVVLSNRARPEVQSLAEAVADLYLGS